MSELARAVTQAPARRGAGRERRRLALITPALPRRTMPFSLLLGALLLSAVVGLLMLTIHISETSFRMTALDQQLQELRTERSYLEEDIAYRSSPQNIAKAAEELGMQIDQNPIYVDLSEGSMSEPDPANTVAPSPGEPVPGPRSDIRDDKRPDLRTSQPQDIVEGDGSAAEDDPEGTQIIPPGQREPHQGAEQ